MVGLSPLSAGLCPFRVLGPPWEPSALSYYNLLDYFLQGVFVVIDIPPFGLVRWSDQLTLVVPSCILRLPDK